MIVDPGCCGDPEEVARLTAEAEARADSLARVQSAVELGDHSLGERGRLALIRGNDIIARLCRRAHNTVRGDQ
jgi:hypothetical protein